MTTTPGPGRVLLRGLAWGPTLGGLLGGAVFTIACVATFALPALVLLPLAVAVGAGVGLVTGMLEAAAVALVARRHPVHPRDGAVVAATVGAGTAFDLFLLGLGQDGGAVVALGVWVGLTLMLGGVGALGGSLVAQPRPGRAGGVSARPNGAAAAAGTASPGWSRAPGR